MGTTRVNMMTGDLSGEYDIKLIFHVVKMRENMIKVGLPGGEDDIEG